MNEHLACLTQCGPSDVRDIVARAPGNKVVVVSENDGAHIAAHDEKVLTWLACASHPVGNIKTSVYQRGELLWDSMTDRCLTPPRDDRFVVILTWYGREIKVVKNVEIWQYCTTLVQIPAQFHDDGWLMTIYQDTRIMAQVGVPANFSITKWRVK